MKISFFNVNIPKRHSISRVLKFARIFLNQPKCMEFSVTFVGLEEIRELNARTRNLDKPTDVLSFPSINLDKKILKPSDFLSDKNFKTGNIMLGDIIICSEIAQNQAREYNHSLKRELCFLALHGFLHLLGYDHMTEADQIEMSKIEQEILNSCKILRTK